MSYVAHIWKEHDPAGTPEAKASWLDHCETQYSEGCSYLDAIDHLERYYTKAQMDAKYFTIGGSIVGLVCETLDTHTASALLAGAAPAGVIAWYQDVSPPAGWVMCNGSNGTDNLAGKFIVGAGDSYNPGNIGGTAAVTITATTAVGNHAITVAEMPSHFHSVTDYYGTGGGYVNNSWGVVVNCVDTYEQYVDTSPVGSGSTHTHTSSFSGDASQEKRPPFYTLAAIQKS